MLNNFNDMKRIFCFLLIVMPFIVSAKYFPGTITFVDGEVLETNIKFPLNYQRQTLKIKRNGNVEKIDANKIKYLKVVLNDGEDEHIFFRGHITYFKDNEEDGKDYEAIWVLRNFAHEKLIFSTSGNSYEIRKGVEDGKIKMMVYVSSSPYAYGKFFSKPGDDRLVEFKSMSFGRTLRNSHTYLFSDCPNIYEKYKNRDLPFGDKYEALVGLYLNCADPFDLSKNSLNNN